MRRKSNLGRKKKHVSDLEAIRNSPFEKRVVIVDSDVDVFFYLSHNL